MAGLHSCTEKTEWHGNGRVCGGPPGRSAQRWPHRAETLRGRSRVQSLQTWSVHSKIYGGESVFVCSDLCTGTMEECVAAHPAGVHNAGHTELKLSVGAPVNAAGRRTAAAAACLS